MTLMIITISIFDCVCLGYCLLKSFKSGIYDLYRKQSDLKSLIPVLNVFGFFIMTPETIILGVYVKQSINFEFELIDDLIFNGVGIHDW